LTDLRIITLRGNSDGTECSSLVDGGFDMRGAGSGFSLPGQEQGEERIKSQRAKEARLPEVLNGEEFGT
jgi:hypothetical protein